MNQDQYYLQDLPTNPEPRTSKLTSIQTLPNHTGWVLHANVQVLPAAAQRPVQTQQVRMRGLGTCLMEGKGKAI